MSVYPKNKFCIWQSVANDKIMGEFKNLQSLKCNSVIPRAVIGELLAVFNLVVGRLNWSLETVVNVSVC